MSIDEIKKEFGVYYKSVQRLHTSVGILIYDLELAENQGYTIHFAIDFAELFAFAYPLGTHMHITELPNEETKYEALTRELVTLNFILSKTNTKILTKSTSLILLPSYTREMTATLTLIKDDIITLDRLISLLQEGKIEAFSKSNSHVDQGIQLMIDELLNQTRNETNQEIKTLSKEQKDWILQYIMQRYDYIVAFLIISSRSRTELLDTLMAEKTIVALKPYFKIFYDEQSYNAINIESCLSDDVINRDSQKYYNLLESIPQRRERVWPNRIDAAACAVLRNINDRLKDRKSILLLITHSASTMAAVDKIEIESEKLPHVRISGTRDLDYFWVYYAYQGNTRKEMLKNLRDAAARLDTFLQTANQILNNKEITDDVLKSASSVLNDIIVLNKQYSNIMLAAKTDQSVVSLLNGITRDVHNEVQSYVTEGMAIVRMVSKPEFKKLLNDTGKHIIQGVQSLEDRLETIQKQQTGT